MENQKSICYEFEGYKLDPGEKMLIKDKRVVTLTPKLFDTLQILVEQHGKTISKEIFLEKLWEETFVEESNLPQYIFHLRRILGKTSNGNSFIETIPKRGYRFTPPVRLTNEKPAFNNVESAPAEIVKRFKNGLNFETLSLPRRCFLGGTLILLAVFSIVLLMGYLNKGFQGNISGVRSAPQPSLAVIFEEEDNTKEKGLEAALVGDLIARLGNLDGLRVRPLASILRVKRTSVQEICHELQADALLLGKVNHGDSRLKVSIRLFKINDENPIWSKEFETLPANYFEVQRMIAEEATRALAVQISEPEKLKIQKNISINFEAFQLYGKGLYRLKSGSEADVAKSIEFFHEAIIRDQTLAPAHLALSEAHAILALNKQGKSEALDHQKNAKENALKAIEIDSSLGSPHALLGAIIFDETRDWNAAEKEFQKAITLEPNNPINRRIFALHLLFEGQFVKAESETARALESDPRSLILHSRLGLIYYFGGNSQMAVKQFEKTLEIDPHFLSASIDLAFALSELNETDKAISIMEKIYNIYPENNRILTTMGYLSAKKGDTESAQRILEKMEKLESPTVSDSYGMALINHALGNNEKAVAILGKISGAKDLFLATMIRFDPKLKKLRNDSRMTNIVSKV